jgi:hypothetical protein
VDIDVILFMEDALQKFLGQDAAGNFPSELTRGRAAIDPHATVAKIPMRLLVYDTQIRVGIGRQNIGDQSDAVHWAAVDLFKQRDEEMV